MSKAWLGSLLRARQVQEDVARERFAHAQRHARTTEGRVHSDDQRVRALLEEAIPGSAAAFIAASSARQAAAATLAAAQQTHAMAEDQVLASRRSLTDAAQQRLSAEKLAEREATEERRARDAAQQQELDEIGSRPRRNDDLAAGA